MSQLTNWGENLLADYIRGQGLPLGSNLDVGLLTAVDDDSYTEADWLGYSRCFLLRSGLVWAGTQTPGSTLPSMGTSHQTSNNAALNFGTVFSGSATITHAGLFSDGDLFARTPLSAPMSVSTGDPVVLNAGTIAWTLGLTGGLSDYFSNKLIDLVWRGMPFVMPSSMHLRLMTALPANAGGGTEVSGAGYGRISVPSTMAAWSGTQGPGTSSASTGTGGRISNNTDLVLGDPTAPWGTVAGMAFNDAPSGGNLLFWAPLDTPKTISPGNPAPYFAADELSITFD